MGRMSSSSSPVLFMSASLEKYDTNSDLLPTRSRRLPLRPSVPERTLSRRRRHAASTPRPLGYPRSEPNEEENKNLARNY